MDKQIHVYLPPEEHTKIKLLATSRQTTISNVIRSFIKDLLSKEMAK